MLVKSHNSRIEGHEAVMMLSRVRRRHNAMTRRRVRQQPQRRRQEAMSEDEIDFLQRDELKVDVVIIDHMT
jgi:hypothetical protein